MLSLIEDLIEEFEAGKMTRRQLIGQLGAVVAVLSGTNRAAACEEQSTFDAVGLNHIALNVTDIKRSRDFYRKHLGLSVRRFRLDKCWSVTCNPVGTVR